MRFWLAILALALFPVVALAGPITIPAYRIATPPVIDGAIHEDSEWKDVPSVSGLVDESTGQKAPDGATFWLAYDDKFIYIAARMMDSQPSLIKAIQYETNVGLQGDDFFQVDLDVSGSTSDFHVFQVNPKGATNIQLSGGRAAKREWAGEFLAASRITSVGWETEMRIPWKVMPLPPAGKKDIRINFERFNPRTNRMFAFVYFLQGALSNTPVWQAVPVPQSDFDHSIKLLPYAYAGYDAATKGVFNSGIDMKTSLADQIQLVGSINPDFRNIENQILSLDFSRFERQANETRPFFLEGSQYLGSALFSSQDIPTFDMGVNSYGKISDKMSFGVLDTVQFGHQNAFVGNATYAPDPATSWRFGATSLDATGVGNNAWLARYQRNWGPYGFFFRDMGSADSLVGRGDNLNAEAFYQGNALFAFGEYSQVTPNFVPRLGFFPEVDYKGYDGNLTYDKPWDHGPFNDAGVSAFYLNYQHMDGSDYRRDADYSAFATLRNGLSFSFDEDAPQFEGSNDHLSTATVSYPKVDPYNQISTAYAWGREAGVYYESTTFSVNRRPLKKLQLIGRYQMVNYAGFNDQAILDASYDLGKSRAIYGRITKQGNDINAYLAYRLSGNLGTEYFVILGDPNALTFHTSLILKVTMPFTIGKKT